MIGGCVLGALGSCACLFLHKPEHYAIAGGLLIWTNVMYGLSLIGYNAYLPVIVEAHEFIALPAMDLQAAQDAELSVNEHGLEKTKSEALQRRSAGSASNLNPNEVAVDVVGAAQGRQPLKTKRNTSSRSSTPYPMPWKSAIEPQREPNEHIRLRRGVHRAECGGVARGDSGTGHRSDPQKLRLRRLIACRIDCRSSSRACGGSG